jgi:hypothetical protein
MAEKSRESLLHFSTTNPCQLQALNMLLIMIYSFYFPKGVMVESNTRDIGDQKHLKFGF